MALSKYAAWELRSMIPKNKNYFALNTVPGLRRDFSYNKVLPEKLTVAQVIKTPRLVCRLCSQQPVCGPISNESNPAHTTFPYLFKIGSILNSHLHRVLPIGPFKTVI